MNCQGLTGFILGHNYKPVFNKEPKGLIGSLKGGSHRNISAALDWDTKKTYVHSECTRCGHKLEKQQ